MAQDALKTIDGMNRSITEEYITSTNNEDVTMPHTELKIPARFLLMIINASYSQHAVT